MYYIEVECKANPSVSLKKAIRSALGLLLSKVPGSKVMHLKDKRKKIRDKDGLPTDWSDNLDGYVHVKGGIGIMTRVHSKHK